MESRLSSWLSYIVLVAAYLSLNSALNLANKWALGIYGFTFPLLLTCCHMGFSFCVLLPGMLRQPTYSKHADSLQKQGKGLVAIGLFMAVNIALNNLSLVEISLSLNQVIRSSIPVFTAILAVFIEGDVPSQGEAVSLVVLTVGVMIAVWEGSATGSTYGIALCLAGTVSNAAMMTTSGKVLKEKIDALRLNFYTAPVSCLALAPFFLAREAGRFAEYRQTHSLDVLGILVISSAVALTYNVVHSLMIQRTSAVATTVLGEAKIVGLLILSSFLLGEHKQFTLRMTVGVGTALVGFCMYSHYKLGARQRAAAYAAAEKSATHTGGADPERQLLLPSGKAALPGPPTNGTKPK